MRSASCLFLIALLVCGALAQKNPLPVVPIVKKGTPTTPPKAVDESNHKKECPSGFSFVGKQCAKTLNAQPEEICPPGTAHVDGKCVKYVGKITECPVGYTPSKGACSKTKNAPAEFSCPPGWNLSGKDSCTRKIALPEKTLCPAGSTTKGDACVRPQYEAPEWTCSSGYTLIGKKCQRDETFDCTPARAPEQESKKEEEHSKPVLRATASKGKGPTQYNLPAISPHVEEYVIQKTCKRIITEDARPQCPYGSNLDGKMCVSDVHVQPITKPGGYRDETIPAVKYCPDGYAESGKECVVTESVLPDVFCPSGTTDDGNRCATYSHPKTVCPDGFFLDGKTCTKTIFAAPVVEYTVTYTCTGKDCGKQH